MADKARADRAGLSLFAPGATATMPTRSRVVDVDTGTDTETVTVTAAADAEYFQLHTFSPIPEECRTQSAVIFVNCKLYYFTRHIDDVSPIPEHAIVGRLDSERLGVPVGRYETLTIPLWLEIRRGVVEIEQEYEADRLEWEKYEATCARYLRLLEAVESVGAGIAGRGLPRDLS